MESFFLALLALVPLPGTSSVSVPLSPPAACSRCHGGFDPGDAFTTWSTSPMGQSVRDPAFLAALNVAEVDLPGVGDLCLRCHAPEAWLQSRCLPPNGARLLPSDSGVTCSVCHRMQPSAALRNAQYIVADDTIMRGPYGSKSAPHQNQRSDFVSSSELCGTCHNFTNPLRRRFDPQTGEETNLPFAEQTTYWEWKASAFALPGGKGCIDCHMKTDTGSVASTAAPRTDRSSHRLMGSNVFVLEAVNLLEPELGLDEHIPAAVAEVRATLAQAATVELTGPRPTLRRGETTVLTVRVTNLTGHKLPSGYPEQEVFLSLRSAALGIDRGALDARTGRPADPLAEYKVVQGQHDIGASPHLALADTVFEDTRLPPRGMVSTATIAPVGKLYPEVSPGVLAHWDDVTVRLAVPCEFSGERVDARVRLEHLSLLKPYVDFLVQNAGAGDRASRLRDAWAAVPARPELIAELNLDLTVDPAACAPPDAGFIDTGSPDADGGADAGTRDTGSVDAVGSADAAAADASTPAPSGGCRCTGAADSRGGAALLALGLVALRRRGSRAPGRS